jgi:Putative zinc-finger
MVIPMSTDPWVDRLSEYVDDDLVPAERLQLEQHLLDCARCRATVNELRDVAAAARRLEDTPPATDLWPAVAAALPRSSSRGWRLTLSLPQALAASVLLMAVSGLTVWMSMSSRTAAVDVPVETRAAGPDAAAVATTVSDPQYDRAVADLTRLLEQRRGRLDPRTVRVIERNLATIDRAINEALAALKLEPTDAYLAAHVIEQRRRKLSLLRQAKNLVLAGAQSD